MSERAYSKNSDLGGEELPVYLGDEETGTITFWVNTGVFRMSLARLANIANRLHAFENAHRPERLGRVVGVREMPTVVFEIVDAHKPIVIPFRRRGEYYACAKGRSLSRFAHVGRIILPLGEPPDFSAAHPRSSWRDGKAS
jgi:hypothetical protein